MFAKYFKLYIILLLCLRFLNPCRMNIKSVLRMRSYGGYLETINCEVILLTSHGNFHNFEFTSTFKYIYENLWELINMP